MIKLLTLGEICGLLFKELSQSPNISFWKTCKIWSENQKIIGVWWVFPHLSCNLIPSTVTGDSWMTVWPVHLRIKKISCFMSSLPCYNIWLGETWNIGTLRSLLSVNWHTAPRSSFRGRSTKLTTNDACKCSGIKKIITASKYRFSREQIFLTLISVSENRCSIYNSSMAVNHHEMTI